MSLRGGAGRVFADQGPIMLGNGGEHVVVAAGVRPVEPAGLHGDGCSAAGQHLGVDGAVDAEGTPRNDGPVVVNEASANESSRVGTIVAGGAGSHDGHGLGAEVPQVAAAHPQGVGWYGVFLVAAQGVAFAAGRESEGGVERFGRPFGVVGGDESAADGGHGCEIGGCPIVLVAGVGAGENVAEPGFPAANTPSNGLGVAPVGEQVGEFPAGAFEYAR